MQINKAHTKANKVRKQIEAKYEETLRLIKKEVLAFIGEYDFIEYKQPVTFEKLAYFKGASNIDALINQVENLIGGIEEFELQIFEEHLSEVYADVLDDIKGIEEALTDKWSGYNYADNIKENNRRLGIRLRREITSSLLRQDNNKQVKATLDKIFKTSKGGSIKILVTETTYVNNKALVDFYTKEGYESYTYISRMDDRACGTCKLLHGQVFKLEEATPGANYPPMHSNCRCTIQEIK